MSKRVIVSIVLSLILLVALVVAARAFTASWEFNCDLIEITFSENVGQTHVIFTVRDRGLSSWYYVRANRVGSSNTYRATNWVQAYNVGFGNYFLFEYTFGDGSFSSTLGPYSYYICSSGEIYRNYLPIMQK